MLPDVLHHCTFPCHLHPCNHADLFSAFSPKSVDICPFKLCLETAVAVACVWRTGVAESGLEALLQPLWFLRFSSRPPCLHRARLCWLLRRAYVQQHAAGLQPGGVLLHCFWSVFPSRHRCRKIYSSPLSLHSHTLEMRTSEGSFSGLRGMGNHTWP